jgi:putative ABC transport system ATP-binding protein
MTQLLDRPTVAPASSAGPRLRATGLVKRFGRTDALRGIDVAFGGGEIVAVMGPSGSGKSTLLHCLAGILRPDEGEVRLDDRRIDTLDESARSALRRTQFGFVFQFGQLVPELSALENVMLPLLLNGARRPEAAAAAAPWLPRLGLAGLGSRRPGELSGGQAQRVAVARAMVAQPRVVFADEPTGSLDSLAGDQVMELLTDAAREHDTTVVLVTHEARVAAYADRQIVVRDGRLSGLGA